MGKSATLQMKVNSVLQDILLKSSSDNVVVDSKTNETLTNRLNSITSDIESLNSGLSGVTDSVEVISDEKIAEIFGVKI